MERRFSFNKKKVSNANKNRFYVNMRIIHVDFGTGTVVAVYDDDIRVRFDSSERGSKRIMKNTKKIMTVEEIEDRNRILKMIDEYRNKYSYRLGVYFNYQSKYNY